MAGIQTEPALAPERASDEQDGHQREPRPHGRERMARAYAALAARPAWWLTLALAGLLCFVTFEAKGGLSLEPMTLTEIVLTLLAGALVAAVAVGVRLPGGRVRGDGLWSTGLLFVLAALTALSIVWSVVPAASWQDAGRMFAYTAVFAASVALVRAAPRSWAVVLCGITLAAVVVCAWAVLTKVFPASLAPNDTFARLEEPYGYWNAIGLTAAMGAIGCMWLGTRRTGHALLNAMAYPAFGLALLTLALAYSRGALAALAIGLLAWFALVPLRLRSAALAISSAVAAGGVAAYAFTNHALSKDRIALAERTSAGHRLGALVLTMLVVLALLGIAVNFTTGRRAPGPIARRQAGVVLLGLIAAAVIAFAGALAHSHRGFTGSISHAVDSLTNPNARTPPNTPDRLTAVASVRARYWKEAIQVFEAHPGLGAGAMGYQTARLRYRTAPLVVAHAHGFVVQTLADLGIVGLLVSLALLAAWLAASGRATHPFNRSWTGWGAWRRAAPGRPGGPAWAPLTDPRARSYGPERIGLLAMLCIVLTFGAHSLVDWTWYIPGNACVALICAGWLAGRGSLWPAAGAAGTGGATAAARATGAAEGATPRDRHTGGWAAPRSFAGIGPARLAFAAAAIVAALLAAWTQWQPQRSESARQQALELVQRNPRAALARAHAAVSRDPLSPLALFTLSDVQQIAGQPALARQTLAKAVREQPSNPQTWLALARYDLNRRPAAARDELRAAIYLNPESIAPELLSPERPDREAIEIYNDYIQALRATQAQAAAQAARAAASRTASAPRSPAATARRTRAAGRRLRQRARTRTSPAHR